MNLKKISLFFLVLSAGAVKMTTLAQVTVFQEDFQSGIPSSWTLRNYDGRTPDSSVIEYTNAWIGQLDPNDSLNGTASSTSFFSPVGRANRWLISPPITLGSFGNSIGWRAQSHDPSFPDDYMVLVSRTDTAKASFTDTIGMVINELASWTDRSRNLSSAGFDNETIYVAFILQTNDGFKLYIDDVLVTKDDPLSATSLFIEPLLVKTIAPGLFSLVTVEEIKSIVVFNSVGQQVGEVKENEIDIRQEMKGVYFAQILTNKGILRLKLTN